ncbi:hypothetical protein E5288_WYG000040 [Bos mutus]|uniref:Uncharacterized protein n=1 Tax=Bos mutus TaxID=72004 RepID=A0A6B0RB40_9CETA|nr:hypothetical protein [Bos mutus]
MRTSGKSLQMKNAHIRKVPADEKCAHLESPCRCKMRTSGKSLQMKNAHIRKVPADEKCAHLESPCR